MEISKINLLILKAFPKLNEKYESDVIKKWDGEEIGPTVLIEDYLMPFIYTNLDNESILRRFSLLLEELIILNDNLIEDILYCSFFEKIHYENLENYFKDYFLERTMSFYKKLSFY